MKKITALLIICLVQCTAILAVIQPPANAGLESCNNVCCHTTCNDKPETNAGGIVGLFQPGNRLNN